MKLANLFMPIVVAVGLTAGVLCAGQHCEQISKMPSATIPASDAPTTGVSSTLSTAFLEKQASTASFGNSTKTAIEKLPIVSVVRSAEKGPHCYWTPCGSYDRCGVGYRNMKEQLCSKFQTNLRCCAF